MRNWNHLARVNNFPPPARRFHSTYEELKQSSIFLFWTSHFSFSFYLWGIETSVSSFIIRYDFNVFILPMRNWNKDNKVLDVMFPWVFSFYLWGIETHVSRKNLFYSGWFSFYLWGIETMQCPVSQHLYSLVFILPMRNWNAPFQIPFAPGIQVFILPMRNWNSNKLCNCPNPVKSFHSTYEELKRHFQFSRRQKNPCFHSTYEELKLKCCIREFTKYAWFSFYLWGIETFSKGNAEAFDFWFSFYLWGIETSENSF